MKAADEWHVAQDVPSWPRCGSLWQVAQVVPSPFSRMAVPVPAGNLAVSFWWHFSHARGECLPVSGNAVRAWSKPITANFAPVTEWHFSQEAPTWPRWGSLWQVAQAVERSRYVLSPIGTGRPFGPVFAPPWHCSHASFSWAPAKSSGNRGCL